MNNTFFRKKSFLRSMIVGTLLFLIPAIVLPTLITANIYTKNILDRRETWTLSSFAVAEERINKLLYDAHTLSYHISQTPEFENYLISASASARTVKKQRKLVKMLDDMFAENLFLNGLVFLKSNGSVFGSTRSNRFISLEDAKALNELRDSLKPSFAMRWESALLIDEILPYRIDRALTEADIHIYGVRRLVYTYAFSEKVSNIDVFVSVTQESLEECFGFLSGKTTDVVLLDSNGRTIAGGGLASFGKIPEFFEDLSAGKSTGSFLYNKGAEDERHIIYYTMTGTGWILVNSTPVSVYSAGSRTLMHTTFIVGGIVVLLMCLIYSIWAVRFCRPLGRMTNTLRKVEEGDLDIRLEENASQYELLTMQRQFNQMLDSIELLLKQREQDEQDKLRLEMRSLQTQISPHFIYNTIASIRWTATMCGANVVADMLISLVSLLRPVFSEWTLDWSLEEELRYMNDYLKLMRIRYGNMIEAQIESDEKASHLIVPRFILQPLLENCCEHTSITSPLEISLRTVYEGDHLLITVDDNGNGMTQERLSEIRDRLNHPDTDGDGIGLANVNRRIKLYYGEKYGIKIESTEGIGTTVVLTLGVKRRKS
ncbi:MAG: histidine kinase [Clostridiales bacterium]|nr:histidine kinase [Clostridiales bacterium]